MSKDTDLERYMSVISGEPNILKLDSWQTPATRYEHWQQGTKNDPGIVGSARIRRRYYKGTYINNSVRDVHFVDFTRRVPITCLEINGKTVMVDDPTHWWLIQDIADKLHGRVLVGGLGLGLILHAMRNNPKVTEIVVIEQNQDVIGLISGKFVSYVNIEFICADLYDFIDGDWVDENKENRERLLPDVGRGFDSAFIDLWVTHGYEDTRNTFLYEVIPTAVRLKNTFEIPMYCLGFNGDKPLDFGPSAKQIREIFADGLR